MRDEKMEVIQRRSPVQFEANPVKTEKRNNWTVVLDYENEGDGPHLVDLSHRPRWDLQDRQIARFTPWGVPVPDRAGDCRCQNGLLIGRMNNTQAFIWHLTGEAADAPQENMYTETTDATVCLALTGDAVFSIAEKLSALDVMHPDGHPPFLLQGPFAHVPCQLVVLERSRNGGMLLIACSRGYAHDLVHAVQDAGRDFGLRPAGENVIVRRLENAPT
jgi:hypothetical protein